MMSNKEWKILLSKEFNVSNSVASEMLHQLYEVKKHSNTSKFGNSKDTIRKNKNYMEEEEDFYGV